MWVQTPYSARPWVGTRITGGICTSGAVWVGRSHRIRLAVCVAMYWSVAGVEGGGGRGVGRTQWDARRGGRAEEQARPTAADGTGFALPSGVRERRVRGGLRRREAALRHVAAIGGRADGDCSGGA